ncbi:MAG: iron ABC transporter permease [Bauldia sp.]|nr:iron ABC transporter permease [Bauldia sp.]
MSASGNDRPHRPGAVEWLLEQPALPLALLAAVLFVASLCLGPVAMSPARAVAGLLGQSDELTNLIVRELRLPRAVLGLAIGATLGLAGATLQGLLRSPLAAPTLFGAPAAAAFASVVAIGLGLAHALSLVLPFVAVLGAGLPIALIVLLGAPRTGIILMILAGLAISTVAAAGIAMAISFAAEETSTAEITFWLLGSLEDRSLQHVGMAVPFLVLSWILLAWDRQALRALTLGDDVAASLGIPVANVRLRVVVGVAAGVGGAVAVAGSIGFVGLVAPFLVRPLVHHDPGRLLFSGALAGAALLLAADLVVRFIPAQHEVNVGIVTALLGGSVFIAMILARRHELVGASA